MRAVRGGDDDLEQGPVRWLNRHAVIQLPATFDQFNAELVRKQLQAVVTRDLLVLIVDLSGTADCDHACGEALAQAYQRAMITGTDLRLLVGAGAVPRLLQITGLDRVVPVYHSMAAAIESTRPADTPPPRADAPTTSPAESARVAEPRPGAGRRRRRSRNRTAGRGRGHRLGQPRLASVRGGQRRRPGPDRHRRLLPGRLCGRTERSGLRAGRCGHPAGPDRRPAGRADPSRYRATARTRPAGLTC